MSLSTLRDIEIDNLLPIYVHRFISQIVSGLKQLRIIHVLSQLIHLFLDLCRIDTNNFPIVFRS